MRKRRRDHRGRVLPRGVTTVKTRHGWSYKARWQRHDGRTGSRSFDDLDAAAEFVAAARVEAQRIAAGLQAPPRPPAPTLRELVDQVLAAPPATWSPKHAADVATRLDLHVLPTLGDLRVDAIEPLDVERVRDGVVEKGRSRSTANKVVAALSAVLSRGRLASNPARAPGLRLSVEETVPEALTDAEALAIIEHADRPWRPLFAAAVYTGARLSELTGSRWADVDLERRIWIIKRSVGERTKSNKQRPVRVPAELVDHLRDIWLGLYDGAAPPGDHLVFRRAHQHPKRAAEWHPYACPRTARIVSPAGALARAAASAKTRRPTFHELRHTHASALVDRGVPLTTVRDQLGHSSLSVTNRYAHRRGRQLEAVDALRLQPPAASRPTSCAPPPAERTARAFEELSAAVLARDLTAALKVLNRLPDGRV